MESTVFQLDYSTLSEALTSLRQFRQIDTKDTFNRFCRSACAVWNECFPDGRGQTSALFTKLREKVRGNAAGTIPTSWGGVVVTKHEHPHVEKFLVIEKGGYLALEKHLQKDEHLEIKEGAGLLLRRDTAAASLVVEELKPGDTYHFPPGMEHCIVGTENLLVFEKSTDPKGMDQDLIFLFTPA